MSGATREHMVALSRRSAEVRRGHARIRGALRLGELDVCEILLSPPPAIGSVLVRDVLRATPRLGEKKVIRLMRDAHVGETRRMRNLLPAQARRLVELIHERHPKVGTPLRGRSRG